MTKRSLFTLASAFITIFVLAGCGQKGPLTLPETPEANQTELKESN